MTSDREVIRMLGQFRVIAILRRIPFAQAIALIDSLVTAGIRAVEITLDGGDALRIIARARQQHGDGILIGAGTVMTTVQLKSALDAGASVLFSPHLDEQLVHSAAAQGALLVPGVMTPTEIVRATNAGATVLKLFPARALGPDYIRDVSGPLSGVLFIPTGGVSPANAAAYLKAGALAVGMGGALVSQSDATDGRGDALRSRVAHLLASIGP